MQGLTDIDLNRLHLHTSANELKAALGYMVRPSFTRHWEAGRYRCSLLELVMTPEEPLPWLPLEEASAYEGIRIVQLTEWTKTMQSVSMYLPLRAERYMDLQVNRPETVLKLPWMTLRIGELADSGRRVKEHVTHYIPYAKICRCTSIIKPFDAESIRIMTDVLLQLSVCRTLEDFLSETLQARLQGGFRL